MKVLLNLVWKQTKIKANGGNTSTIDTLIKERIINLLNRGEEPKKINEILTISEVHCGYNRKNKNLYYS